VATCNSGGSSIIVSLVYVIYIIIQKCLAAISSPHSTSLFNLVLRTHAPTYRNVSAWSSASNWSIYIFCFFFLLFNWGRMIQKTKRGKRTNSDKIKEISELQRWKAPNCYSKARQVVVKKGEHNYLRITL